MGLLFQFDRIDLPSISFAPINKCLLGDSYFDQSCETSSLFIKKSRFESIRFEEFSSLVRALTERDSLEFDIFRPRSPGLRYPSLLGLSISYRTRVSSDIRCININMISQVHAWIGGGGSKSEEAGLLPGTHAFGAENGEHVVPRDVRGCDGAAILLHVARCVCCC